MAIQIQVRRDTASNWSSNNPILAVGEIGFSTDTYQVKIGDGVTLWNSLDYFSDIDAASASLLSYIDERVEDIVGLSPETLDTLEELAAALNDDPDFFNTISASVTSASAFALSEANDYTDGEITSLEGALASASAQAILDANSYTDGEITSLEGALASASAQAILDANSYTDGEITTLEGLLASASAQAILDANSYTDGEITSLEGSLASASAQAILDANSYTDGEVATAIVTASAAAVNYADGLTTTDIEEGSNLYFTSQRAIDSGSATYILQENQQTIINSASAAAADYADQAVADLVDSAPETLDTLKELADALGNDENFATTVINTIASASANAINSSKDYTDDEVETAIVTASAAAVSSANSYTDGEITSLEATLASASAQSILDANSYTDGEVATAIVTASAAAAGYTDNEISSLTTLDIEENTNLYFTEERSFSTASTALVHINHIGLSASVVGNEIILDIISIDGGEA